VAQWRPPGRYQDLGRSAAHGLRDEAAKLLRLPRVGLHLCVGKISLQSQDVSFGQLACQRAASVGVFPLRIETLATLPHACHRATRNIGLDGLQTVCHVGRHGLNFLDLSYECPELIATICNLQIQNLAETLGSG